MSEDKAVNVINEAAEEYYSNFDKLPQSLKKEISCHMLHDIFKVMVLPAIDRVRMLDRKNRI